jgi:DNA modification methylase
MSRMESESIDFILTDPPYITHYRSRDGRTVINDDNARWLRPAFTQMYRLLKNGSFCVSFYGWNTADLFISAWRSAGQWSGLIQATDLPFQSSVPAAPGNATGWGRSPPRS